MYTIDQKAMHVRGVESGVCGFSHNTAYRVLLLMSEVSKFIVLCIQWLLAPARREGYCVSLPSWGFSCSPLVSPRRQLC